MQVEGAASTVRRGSYVRFNGGESEGLELPLDLPEGSIRQDFDYTLMFWFRSGRSLAELRDDETLLRQRKYLFDIPTIVDDSQGSLGCYVHRDWDYYDGEPYLGCTTSDEFKIRLEFFPDIEAWMHLTYSTDHVPVSNLAEPESTSYLKVQGISVTDKVYARIDREQSKVYYGAGSKVNKCELLPEDDP